MAASKTFLVPVDFSRGSDIALKHALQMAHGRRARLLVVHVLPMTVAYPAEGLFTDYYGIMEKNAREQLKKLFRRMRLKPGQYRSILIHGDDTARAIADQARKSRAAMIIMGSYGKTGFQRFMLGSVAERTLRYARCPVLVVKK